jgi:acetyl-CoA synthetase (ADP-forming)
MDQVVETARKESRHLSEAEAYELLEAYGFLVPSWKLVASADEAVQAASELGYPVALKVCSPRVLHKSDLGGVALGLSGPEAVEKAFGQIRSRLAESIPEEAQADILVVPMASAGLEVILGMTRDEQFGPAVMFGLGGVWVELLKDVTFRLVPLSEAEARRMIDEIRAAPLLKGYRGEPPRDVEAIVRGLLGLSKLVEANPAIVSVDINPLVVYQEGSLVVDAKVLIEGAQASA